jgi:hypothetical protein
MARLIRIMLIVGLLVAWMPVVSATAEAPAPPVPNTVPSLPFPNCKPFVAGTTTGPQVYLICLPWATPPAKFDLVIFAHGYVAINEPMDAFLTQLQLSDGSTIPGLANGLGFAFATTSYRKNGLAVKEGIDDVAELVAFFKAYVGTPKHIYLIGASEGGLVTTLSIEKRSALYTGGLAMCGPIGDFRSQINYWGDFLTLFDYFYPAYAIPHSPVDIDETIWPSWASLSQAIGAAVFTGGHTTEQFLRTSRAPIDLADPRSVISTTIGILSYNVFATNEGKDELSGQPFDNWTRWYMGSDNDRLLNRSVPRFHADQSAINQINASYQTSGRLSKPLITLHTTGDPIVPYWHEPLYTAKTLWSGSLLQHINIPILRYGHCNFKSSEALFAFVLLVLRSGLKLDNPEKVLTTDTARAEFKALMQQYKSELEGSR